VVLCEAPAVSPDVDPRVQSVLESIAAASGKPIAELARSVRMSSSRLQHLVKAETGISLRDHMRLGRVRRAAYMLCSSNLSIKEVCFRVGYQHPASLSRAFRRTTGSSPQLYRRVHSAHHVVDLPLALLPVLPVRG
jgi:AraC family transcriptional regulator, arabinose operon regulatory protein